MLSITLSAQDEYQWQGENPAPRTFRSKGQANPCYPLYHQWRTSLAEAPIIVNTYNTGTGKTKAALLRLLRRIQQRQGQLSPTRDNVLLIAPTNELLEQHAADAEQFCSENELPYHVVRITAELLDRYTQQYKDEQQFLDEHIRKGWVFYDILLNPSLADPQHDTSKSLAIYVINPDIFYYISYLLYNQQDRAKLFVALNTINYIIIDELHYYTPKQLAAFLFFIQFSHENGFIDKKQRQFCLLTATPRPQVEVYLHNLDLPIDWITPIKPQQVPEDDRPFIVPTRALTPVELHVYSTEELRESESSGGLLELVQRKRKELRRYVVEQELDGAIIANSLGMLNALHYALTGVIAEEKMGRITGPQKRESRRVEKRRQLILATPTVDIGYNFARSEEKKRQNIDFLFIDAYSGDELVQRIGRAGRVLSKPEKEHVSIVFAVVDPETYKQLCQYDNQELAREQLAELVKAMPQKNDLYAYIRTGAIFEAFRPLQMLRQGMDDQERKLLNDFIERLQRYFASTDEQRKTRPVPVEALLAHARTFQEQDKAYQGLRQIPPQTFERYELWHCGILTEEQLEPAVKNCLERFSQRLEIVQKKGEEIGNTTEDFMKWALHDLALYHKERARFSFRDSFQPPLALFYDPGRLHSSDYVNCYNAMHILKYYEFSPYETIEELLHDARPEQQRENWRDAIFFCRLNKFRDKPLRLGFHLDERQYTQAEWEEQWAYQVTALYGLKVIVESDQRSQADTLHNMLAERFIPAFVYEQRNSITSAQVHQLQNKARFYPYQLRVDFCDHPGVVYDVIVGSMAFHICAELPFWAMMRDRYKRQREANEPIIC